MPSRVAVIQRHPRSLDGLCMQLRHAGYAVLESHALPSMRDLSGDQPVDLLVADAEHREIGSILRDVEEGSSLGDASLMLIAPDDDKAAACAGWSERIDEVLALPIGIDRLKARADSLCRSASAAVECRRRRLALADFDIVSPPDVPRPGDVRTIAALIVGPADDRQFELLKALDGSMAVSFADGVTDALSHLGRASPDVVMVASGLRSNDFRTLLSQLRSRLDWCDLPVLVVAESASFAEGEISSCWGAPELLLPSSGSALTCLRMRTLVRQGRLRRRLRSAGEGGMPAAVTDSKTGLCDHSFFHHYVDRSIIEHRRRHAPLAIVVCALRGLREVNETLGYPEGDRVLVDVARGIAGHCRVHDLVARIGGSRFGILLSDSSASTAEMLCRRLARAVRTASNLASGGRRAALRIELGQAQLTTHDTASTLLRRALGPAPHQPLRHAS